MNISNTKQLIIKFFFQLLDKIGKKPIFAFWAIIVLILSLIPSSTTPQLSAVKIPHFDKIIHFIFYFVLSFLLMLRFNITKYKINKIYVILISIIVSTIYGGMIEIMQDILTTERVADIFDFLTNFVGATIGTFLFIVLLKQKKNSIFVNFLMTCEVVTLVLFLMD